MTKEKILIKFAKCFGVELISASRIVQLHSRVVIPIKEMRELKELEKDFVNIINSRVSDSMKEKIYSLIHICKLPSNVGLICNGRINILIKENE